MSYLNNSFIKKGKMSFVPPFVRHIFSKIFDYILVCASGLFDKEWYTDQYYQDVSDSGMSPFQHFYKRGFLKAYSPSKRFCSKRYWAAYPSVARKQENPLLHYLKKGRFNGYIRYDYADAGRKKKVVALDTPFVSVVITSYNYAAYIRQTLESVLKQTYRNFEILVVDDGSEDNSVKIIKEYVDAYENVRLITHENGANKGLVASMKLGIELAQGEYVAFCESDDYWSAGNLERKIRFINDYEDIVIVSNDVNLVGDDECIRKRMEYLSTIRGLLINGGNKIDVKHNQECNFIPTLSSVLIKRSVLEALDFNTPIPAWIDFWLYRQILKDNLLYYVDECLTYWRQHESYNGVKAIEESAQMKMLQFIPASNRLIRVKVDKAKAPHAIRHSKLFDKKYYISQVSKGIGDWDPALHYYVLGWKQGLNPSASFDGDAYLSRHAELLMSQQCPLFHFEKTGRKEGLHCFPVSESRMNAVHLSDLEEMRMIREKQCAALLITHELTMTGAPRALLYLALMLKKLGLYPVIVSPCDGELRHEIEKNGIECKIFYSLISHTNSESSPQIQFVDYAREFNFVLFNTLATIPFVKGLENLDTKKYCWIHEGKMNFDFLTKGNDVTSYMNLFDDVFVVGDYVRQILQEHTSSLKPSQTLLYGINDVRLAPCANKGEKVTFVMCGAIEKRKGYGTLMDCLDALSKDICDKMRIVVVGAFFDRLLVERIKKYKRVEIQLMGEVDHSTILNLMNSADILLCPSLDDPMPIVCTEAMMLSKPLIVSDHTGTASMIEKGREGYVVRSGDANSLAQSITNAIADVDLLPEKGRQARCIYEKYFTAEIFEKNIRAFLLPPSIGGLSLT